MAEYYGFDGYFLNQEEGYYEDFKPFMAELTEAGLYTQWYDTIVTLIPAKHSGWKTTPMAVSMTPYLSITVGPAA